MDFRFSNLQLDNLLHLPTPPPEMKSQHFQSGLQIYSWTLCPSPRNEKHFQHFQLQMWVCLEGSVQFHVSLSDSFWCNLTCVKFLNVQMCNILNENKNNQKQSLKLELKIQIKWKTQTWVQLKQTRLKINSLSRYMNTYLDCVKDAVEEECGSDAAAYQDKVTRLATAPIIESIGCDIEIGKLQNTLKMLAMKLCFYS